MRSDIQPIAKSSRCEISAIDLLMVSTSYPVNLLDWRGLFIRHLAEALARHSDIRLRLWSPPGEVLRNATYVATLSESRWLARLMAQGGIAHIMRRGGVKGLVAPLRLLWILGAAYRRHPGMDVYHINWLQCALPLPSNGKPVLLTVLGNDMKLLRLPLMRHLLRRVLCKRRAAICPNAEWMIEPLSLAFGDIAEITPVVFGIDPMWYAVCRDVAPTEPAIWLAITRLTRDKLGPLFEWSEALFKGQRRKLHLFGPMQEQIAIPDWVHFHGPATPNQLAHDWFPRAQGILTLSRHAEGRPQVMLEAMAAGLPIIASDMLAHASIVADRRTGELCNSSEAYAAAVNRIEDPSINQQYGSAARQWAMREVGTWDDCAERYVRIYRRLLAANLK